MAHLEPLPEEQLLPFKDVFDAMRQKMGFVPNSLKTMARKPNILKAFANLALEVSSADSIGIELKYLMGLIASQVSGCMYCQAHLAVTSEVEHVPDEKVAAVWLFEQSDLFSEAERSALRFARDAAQQPNQVTDEHYRDLSRYYSEEEIVGLLAFICLFRWLNCWNDSMATQLEAEPLRKAGQLFSAQGWQVGKHVE